MSTATIAEEESLHPIFIAATLEKSIRRDGFAITNFLTPVEFEELSKIVHAINDDDTVKHEDVHVNTDFRLR